MFKHYEYRGKEIFVKSIRGSLTDYGTVFRSSNGGAVHQIEITALPTRITAAEAQMDLDAFANARKLKEIAPKVTQKKTKKRGAVRYDGAYEGTD